MVGDLRLEVMSLVGLLSQTILRLLPISTFKLAQLT